MTAPPSHELDLASALEAPDGLLRLLEQQARQDGLSNRQLSRNCHIDHTLYSRVRRGVRGERFGVGACARIVACYPHLREAAARYLGDSYEPAALELLADVARVVRATDADNALAS